MLSTFMATALIAGAASGLTPSLIESLKLAETEIDALVRQSVPPCEGDFRAIHSRCEDLAGHYDTIYLVGAYIPKSLNQTGVASRLFHDNIKLVHQIVNRFAESRIVFTSSVAVIDPNSDYAVSKAAGEGLLQGHRSWAVIRLSSIYGIGMKQSNFISRAVDQAIKTGVITLFGPGKRTQDYLHYRDASRILIAAAERTENRIYLGAFGQPVSNLTVAQEIQRQLPEVEIRHTSDEEGDSFRYDASETWTTLGLEPKVNLESGIRELINEWKASNT